jgi:hypothetical protein
MGRREGGKERQPDPVARQQRREQKRARRKDDREKRRKRNEGADNSAARPERAEDGERARDEPERESGTGAARPEQQISAPSLGPNTVIEREPVEERLARHDQSDVDAMGLGKRRSVVGESLGPSKARQFAVYLGFLAILAALVVGGIILVGSLDTSVGKNVPNSAPWAKPGAKQSEPKPIQ